MRDKPDISLLGLKKLEVDNKKVPCITIVVVGDINDGDYVTTNRVFILDTDEALTYANNALTFIKSNKKQLLKDYEIKNNTELVDEIIDYEYFYIPCISGEMCNTIDSISIRYTDETGATYEMDFK